MGITLDELLENSGIGQLGHSVKVASARPDSDEDGLIDALRKLASEEPEPTKVIRESAARELAEKTAEILVVKQTMEEIEKISSVNIDGGHNKIATFIKVAIDKGHTEEEIATFLKDAGIVDRVGRAIQSGAQSVRRVGARRASEKVVRSQDAERALLRSKLISGNYGEAQKHLSALEARYGRKAVETTLGELQTAGEKLPGWVAKKYPIPTPGRTPAFSVKGPGGSEHTVSVEGLKRYGIPAAAVGGGVALGASKKENRGGRGVTIVS